MRTMLMLALAIALLAACGADTGLPPLEPVVAQSPNGKGPPVIVRPTETCDPFTDPSCGSNPGGTDPCPGCLGLSVSGLSESMCLISAGPPSDRDWDGFADDCEYALSYDFKPAFAFDSRDDHLAREPYWAVRPLGNGTYRIFYAIAYHTDGGAPAGGIEAHEGDSEFVVLDVSYYAPTNRWLLNQAFLSAHYQAPNDQSQWYQHTQLQYGPNWYGVVHNRGRPKVWVANQKHANYATQTQCYWYEQCNGYFPGSLDIRPEANLGGNYVRLVDGTTSYLGRPGVEYFWSGSSFCGWSNTSCGTSQYGSKLYTFGM